MTKTEGFAKITNSMMDALMRTRLAGEEAQVFWVIVRKTTGFNKRMDSIALSQFERETGIIKTRVHRLLKNLIAKNIILVQEGDRYTWNGYPIKEYAVNAAFESWRQAPKKNTLCKHSGSSRSKMKVVHQPSSKKSGLAGGNFFTPMLPIKVTAPLLPVKVTAVTNKGHDPLPLLVTTTDRQTLTKTDNTTDSPGGREEERKWKILNSLIKLAANRYGITILGSQVKMLRELLRLHDASIVERGFKNFSYYQGISLRKRRYPLGNNFNSFVRKFDQFVDQARVEQRLEVERRWYEEAQKAGGVSDQTESEEQWIRSELKEAERLYQNRLSWIKHVEEAAREKGCAVKEALDPPSFNKYRRFKTSIEQDQENINQLRQRIAGGGTYF